MHETSDDAYLEQFHDFLNSFLAGPSGTLIECDPRPCHVIDQPIKLVSFLLGFDQSERGDHHLLIFV